MIPRPDNPLIVALDVSEVDAAEALARRLDGEAGILKVGLELFAAHGPEAVSRMRAFAPVFLDVKLHDIPTTVEGAARNCARLGVAMLTVHALGGEAMVAAAVRGALSYTTAFVSLGLAMAAVAFIGVLVAGRVRAPVTV